MNYKLTWQENVLFIVNAAAPFQLNLSLNVVFNLRAFRACLKHRSVGSRTHGRYNRI